MRSNWPNFAPRVFFTNQLYGMIIRNSGRPILWVIKLLIRIGGKLTPVWVASAKRQVAFLHKLAKTRGRKGLVKYLKASSVILQQSICGHKLPDSMSVGARVGRTGSGLPRWITSNHRKMIRGGNTRVVTFYLTIWSVYREILYPPVAKISTITSPFSGDPAVFNRLYRYIAPFTRAFCGPWYFKDTVAFLAKNFTIFPIMKSSPTSSWRSTNYPVIPEANRMSTHPWSLFLSLIAFNGDLALRESVMKFIEIYLSKSIEINSLRTPIANLLSVMTRALQFKLKSRVSLPLGKIGQKEEAAGKMRIFAMVDPVTQWLLRPIHRLIFRILRRCPMDGTFDQLKPLNRVPFGKPLYSLDLSAATDRLPIVLQQLLLLHLLKSSALVEHWGRLMVGRPYSYTDKITGQRFQLRYAVGQPMGALSSWAMLAYTHHFIVQVAAWRSGVVSVGKLFKGYAVLGDDICIFNKKVSLHYLKLVKSLGVECNLSKSIISPKGLGVEFAKKTFYKGVNVSPTPFAELGEALRSLPALIELGRKYKLSFPSAVAVAGFGYKVLGGLNKPYRELNSRIRVMKFSFNLPSNSSEYLAGYLHNLNTWMPGTQIPQLYASWIKVEWDKLSSKIIMTIRLMSDLHSSVPKKLSLYKIDKDYNSFLRTLYDMVYYPYYFNASRALSSLSTSMMFSSHQDFSKVFSLWDKYLDYCSHFGSYSLTTMKIERNDNVIDRTSTKAWVFMKKFSDHVSLTVNAPVSSSEIRIASLPLHFIAHGFKTMFNYVRSRGIVRAWKHTPLRYANWGKLGLLGMIMRFSVSIIPYLLEWFTLAATVISVAASVVILVDGIEILINLWVLLIHWLSPKTVSYITSAALLFGITLPVPLPWYWKVTGWIRDHIQLSFDLVIYYSGNLLTGINFMTSLLFSMIPGSIRGYLLSSLVFLFRDIYNGSLMETLRIISQGDYWASHPFWAFLMAIVIHLVFTPGWELSRLVWGLTWSGIQGVFFGIFAWLQFDSLRWFGELSIFVYHIIFDVGFTFTRTLLVAAHDITWIANGWDWFSNHPIEYLLATYRLLSRFIGWSPFWWLVWVWGSSWQTLITVIAYLSDRLFSFIPLEWFRHLIGADVRLPRVLEGRPSIDGGPGIIRQAILAYIRSRGIPSSIGEEFNPDIDDGDSDITIRDNRSASGSGMNQHDTDL